MVIRPVRLVSGVRVERTFQKKKGNPQWPGGFNERDKLVFPDFSAKVVEFQALYLVFHSILYHLIVVWT